MSQPTTPILTESDALALLDSCSNRGRWGDDDEAGTLNLITAEHRRRAVSTVRDGRVVALGRPLTNGPHSDGSLPVVRRMLYERHRPWAALDTLEVAAHGLTVTHMDAVGHVYHDGGVYNGRHAESVVTQEGVAFGSIAAMRGGIATRGVLLDIAGSRGVDWLEPGAAVTRADLDRAEVASGVHVSDGDAMVVRVGIGAMVASGIPDAGPLRAGLGADCLAWMHARGVAVYAGDCVERQPSPYPALPLPLHQIGLVAMGLAILDKPRRRGARLDRSRDGPRGVPARHRAAEHPGWHRVSGQPDGDLLMRADMA